MPKAPITYSIDVCSQTRTITHNFGYSVETVVPHEIDVPVEDTLLSQEIGSWVIGTSAEPTGILRSRFVQLIGPSSVKREITIMSEFSDKYTCTVSSTGKNGPFSPRPKVTFERIKGTVSPSVANDINSREPSINLGTMLWTFT